MTESFGARCRTALDVRGPLCVGIDAHASLLSAWGLPDDPAGLERFALTVVDALADRVAVLKPQSAFFERHGSRGIAVLERTIAAARAAGALVLLDAKRGDVGSTVEAYAQAYLDRASPIFADAITASPYLGFESLRPLLRMAVNSGAGVFVLTYTSNAEAPTVQAAIDADRKQVGAAMLDRIATENIGAQPLGSVGAVIGATLDRLDYDLAKVNGPVLAPGYGAQGGGPADLGRLFAGVEPNVIPATSREVLTHGPDIRALRDAAARARDMVPWAGQA